MRARATLISSAPGFIKPSRRASISPWVSGARAQAIWTVSHSGSIRSSSANGKAVSGDARAADWVRVGAGAEPEGAPPAKYDQRRSPHSPATGQDSSHRPHRRGSRSPAASSPWRECVARRWRQNVQEIGLLYGAPLPTHDESAIVGASATRRKEFGSRLLPKTRHTTARQ